jgi:2-oxoglutarate ferredoxin oxidoreductase subunit beta
MFNNEIYGLTKPVSPTSLLGRERSRRRWARLDWPFNPLSGNRREAAFVARAIDTDRAHLTETLRAAAAHRGSGFVEIFQNCNIYNDGAFDFVPGQGELDYSEQGKPIPLAERGRASSSGRSRIVDVTDESELLVHNAHHAEPSAAFALSRLTQSTSNATPIGIFRDVQRPVYDDLMSEQLATAREKQEGDIAALLQAGDTWTI